jgi:alkyl hydroperoxide reductase subunit AhpF
MSERLLDEEIIKQITELFNAQLIYPVELIYFSKNESCGSCEDTHQLLEEVSSISDKVHLSTYNLNDNPELARQYQIDLSPGLVITGRDGDIFLDYGLRFAGIPSGYEFSSLIQGILLVSKRDSGLKPEIRNELKGLTHPVSLKVFVTPT